MLYELSQIAKNTEDVWFGWTFGWTTIHFSLIFADFENSQ
jgi:hypothetical protein